MAPNLNIMGLQPERGTYCFLNNLFTLSYICFPTKGRFNICLIRLKKQKVRVFYEKFPIGFLIMILFETEYIETEYIETKS